ncbi:response regulator [Nitrosopumilus maritimus]|uniref:Response regulator receiver protein n=1 Tax=Nitrosopumilus maritimus (strain SCM1) TaxID=436308 RepID=A9A319_NITMS|nr:response regulator [Nitrosopumilus maritimus]ABX12147.1 response regulator receiver protein [Nitrosopumilus maritimus SCM1]
MAITAIVAEDDEANLELFSEILELNNVTILSKVVNGKEAVDSFESQRPDIVFLDIMMPDFDGLYALENIRKIDPSAKVVMVTADTSSESEAILEKLQPNAVIHKPYEVSTITHIIEDKLDLKIQSN